LRAIFKGMSAYYDQFLEVHRFTRNKRVIGLASLELVQAMVHVRDELGVPVVGLDIAGPERGYPPDDHQEAIAIAHRHFFMKTVHAGEAYGPESIFQAITLLHADRIGHGYYLFSANMVKDLPPRRAALYIRNLVQYIADRRITIEVCLTSNMQTNPTLRDLRKHSFSKMMQERLSTTLCTDNHTVSKTNITQELRLACQTFDLSPRELRDIIVYGFKRSFFPGTYRQKRSYVRRIIDYYDSVVARYNHGTRPAKP
jgi:adenosine deaminase